MKTEKSKVLKLKKRCERLSFLKGKQEKIAYSFLLSAIIGTVVSFLLTGSIWSVFAFAIFEVIGISIEVFKNKINKAIDYKQFEISSIIDAIIKEEETENSEPQNNI